MEIFSVLFSIFSAPLPYLHWMMCEILHEGMRLHFILTSQPALTNNSARGTFVLLAFCPTLTLWGVLALKSSHWMM